MSNTHAGTAGTTGTRTIKGAGLARGPALVLGTILAVFGLILFLHSGATPTNRFPDGDATAHRFIGFESNGWTAFFTTTAGVILLFGAAQHLLAKTASLIVGIALAASVVLDLVDGPGVLGLAAANWATDLGWGIAAVLLLLNIFAPRVKKEEPIAATHRPVRDDATATATGTERPATPAPTGAYDDTTSPEADPEPAPIPGSHGGGATRVER